jgi:ChrR Cupin-like domain
MGWQDFGPGLRIKVLHHDGGVVSYLLRLAPAAALPVHRHPIDEECVVIEGEVQIAALRLGAGGFHLGRKDMLRDQLQSRDGALIFLRGAKPEVGLVV